VFHRRLTKRALLYTEMVTTGAILFGDRERLLGFSPEEHPVALQLGGSDPKDLATSARVGADWGYDEINLNVGCPSDRVQSGRFGACLMQEPDLVAECVAAMKAVVDVPVTVKCRIGVDDQDPEMALFTLVERVKAAGVDGVIVHARKAWLKGLSPKENRTVPPLDYALVYRLKAAHPDLTVSINGGIGSIAEAKVHLQHVDGVMLGRAAYETPGLLAFVDRDIFDAANDPADPVAVLEGLIPYADECLAKGLKLSHLTRHVLGLFNGQPGARAFRRLLTVEGPKPGATSALITEAIAGLLAARAADAARATERTEDAA
jgi:tRNA-dihydrouridine synthase A